MTGILAVLRVAPNYGFLPISKGWAESTSCKVKFQKKRGQVHLARTAGPVGGPKG